MDLLKEGMKNISLYEVKKQVRKAQNVVLNYSEMESKVREATNNEPWGTSSKKMQEIAAGTYNYREREEICGMIFRRFTEKTASEWRQIYKALILLEYLIKHGSERFVDDARANMSLISMLKSFHYIDSQGRDQGINIRNRSKLLLALLNDDSKIRTERKKARENAKKFGGVAGGAPSFGGSSRSGFGGGFDDDDGYDYPPAFGSAASQVYGDGGVYGNRFEEPRATGAGANDFEEYDAGPSTSSSSVGASTRPPRVNRAARRSQRSSAAGAGAGAGSTSVSTQQPQQQQASTTTTQDLFSFDDEPVTAGSTATATANNNNNNNDDDDEFDDFQSAAPVTNQTQQQASGISSNALSNLYAVAPTATAAAAAPAPQQQNFDLLSGLSSFNSTPASNGINSNNAAAPAIAAAGSSNNNNDAFSSLFSSAKTTTFKPSSNLNRSNTGSNNNSRPETANNNSNNNSNFDDLFGDFNSNAGTSNNNTNGNTNGKQSQSTSTNANDLDLLSF